MLQKTMLAIGIVFAVAFAFLAPGEASASYTGTAAALARTVPHQNIDKTRYACRWVPGGGTGMGPRRVCQWVRTQDGGGTTEASRSILPRPASAVMRSLLWHMPAGWA